jgi:hypothetical protein
MSIFWHYFNVTSPSTGDEFRLRVRLSFARASTFGFNPKFALSNAGDFEVLEIGDHLPVRLTFLSFSEDSAEANTPWGFAVIRKNPRKYRFEIALGGSQLVSLSYNFLHTRARLAFLHGDGLVFKTVPLSDNMRSPSKLGDCRVHYEGIHHAQRGRIGWRELRREWNRRNSLSLRSDGRHDTEAAESLASNSYFYQWRISIPSENPAKNDVLIALAMLISYRFLATLAVSTLSRGPLDVITGGA